MSTTTGNPPADTGRNGNPVLPWPDAVPHPDAGLGECYRHRPAPQRRGWRGPGGGFAANLTRGTIYQGTSVQICGLYPFACASGATPPGVPIGIHQLTAEPIGLDPAEWLRTGVVSNTGMWVQGQPGIGKSALVKRMITGLVSFGMTAVIPGDVKGEYTGLVEHLGGQVCRLGQGLHALNPLDTSFLRAARDQSVGTERHHLENTILRRRRALLEGLISIVRRRSQLDEPEQLLLWRVLDLAVTARRDSARAQSSTEPTIPDLVRILHTPTQELREVIATDDDREFRLRSLNLRATPQLLCEGPLMGMFDRPSSIHPDLSTPALSLDISALDNEPDDVVAAAMLSSWAWAAAVIDASTALGRRRNVLRVQDELWRALRVAPGLVERSDQVTRLGRHRGEVSMQITHSQDDLQALPTEEDRAKAAGMAARCGVVILGGMAERELHGLGAITKLTHEEASMITRWAAPPGWKRAEGTPHPGRGKYLIKSGERMGLPVSMTLTPTEMGLYDTDTAWTTTERAPA